MKKENEMKRKNGLKWKETKKEDQSRIGPSHGEKNDPWSDHPETQFGPVYPFFRN